MTKGLLKSATLHLGILLIFMYGAEIFKKNKRFEIYEIPLDIVDVSEETTNKLEKTKQKIKKVPSQENQYFSPPKPKSRPKNPEFALEEKKKEKNVEKTIVKEKTEKSKKKINRMDSILKSIEKVKSENQKLPENKENKELVEEKEKEKDVKEISLGEKLTISEKDAIRRQFYRCWIVPAGAKNLKELVVSVKIKLNQEGEVVFSKIINDKMLGNNTFFRAASESAMRAVNHPECKKLKVPKKKYDTWNEIILDFDPSQSLN
jgi:hypothetical protein